MVKENFIWVGERLWLDAVNAEFIREGVRTDGWSDASALESWAHQAGTRREEAAALSEFALDENGAALLSSARELRASLREICEQAHAGAPIDLEKINAALNQRGVISSVEPCGAGYAEREHWSGERADVTWIIARSAARSLWSGELERVKPCANPDCILWFLDVSKNGKRRWCSMEGCGNRHKVAAHHRRRKGAVEA